MSWPPVSPSPLIFVSAVSRELRSARQLVANTLIFLGYQPVWQDIFGTEQGDLRAMLRQQIDQCKGLVQLVGQRYGAEPPVADEQFGRVSYTQYEALYAAKKGKKVWYLFMDENFPVDTHEPESDDRRQLQDAYRHRLQSDTRLFHPLRNTEGLEASVLKLRNDLIRLRRGVKQWAAAVAILLVLIAGSVFWLLRGQTQMTGEMAKLQQAIREYSHVEHQVREAQSGDDPAAIQERIYVELGKQLQIDPKFLREKLQPAAEAKSSSSSSGTSPAKLLQFVPDQRLTPEASLQQAGLQLRSASGKLLITAVTPNNMEVAPHRTAVLLMEGGPQTRLEFALPRPARRVFLERIGTRAGSSIPTWWLETLDSAGNVLDIVGEVHGLPRETRTVELRGPNVAAIRLTTDNRNGPSGTWATWSCLPFTELAWEE
jgi:hypothetical protein